VSLVRLLNQPLTVQRIGPTGTDSYGNEVAGAIGAPVAVVGYLEQQSSAEFTNNRDTVVGQWVAYLPAGTAISHLDRVAFQSQTFEVNGEPEHAYNPRTRVVSHIACRLTVIGG
jgi:hypothetical protein